MAGKLFDKLEREAFRGGIQARTKESMRWFKQRVSTIKGVSRQELLRDATQRKRQIFGDMYMYMYDPKHKKTLPYYDRFPLCIPVEPAKGGFYGLNLHYLPHSLRAQFLDALYDTTNNDKYDETTRFRLTYDLLKCLSMKPINKLDGLELVNSPCQYLYRNCALNFVISPFSFPRLTTPSCTGNASVMTHL